MQKQHHPLKAVSVASMLDKRDAAILGACGGDSKGVIRLGGLPPIVLPTLVGSSRGEAPRIK